MNSTAGPKKNSIVLPSVTGFCLFVIALGINRYSLAPMIPFLVHYHWLTTPQAGYVGSGNFLSYFFSAYLGQHIAHRFKRKNTLLFCLISSILVTFLSAFNLGYAWQWIWRFGAGFISGVMVIITPSTILYAVPYRKSAIVSGLAFADVGMGVIIVSVLLSVFDQWHGMSGIWLGLTFITILLSALAYVGLRNHQQSSTQSPPKPKPLTRSQLQTLWLIAAGYALYTFGVTPSQLFLSDFAYQQLHASLHVSSTLFSLFGVGCILGALLAGSMHKKLSNYWSLLLTTGIGIIALLLIIVAHAINTVYLSAVLTGFYIMAIIVLTSLFISDYTSIEQHPRYWSYLTLGAAGSQFFGGYIFSYLLSLHISYRQIFTIGLYCLIVSGICYALTAFKFQAGTNAKANSK